MTNKTKADTYEFMFNILFVFVQLTKNEKNIIEITLTATLSKVQTIFITFNWCEAVIMTHKIVLTGNLHDIFNVNE